MKSLRWIFFDFLQIRRAKRNILGLDPGPEEEGPDHVLDTGNAVAEMADTD